MFVELNVNELDLGKDALRFYSKTERPLGKFRAPEITFCYSECTVLIWFGGKY